MQNNAALLDGIEAKEAYQAQQEIKARRAIDEHEAGHEPF
jgi:hypothetical protein